MFNKVYFFFKLAGNVSNNKNSIYIYNCWSNLLYIKAISCLNTFLIPQKLKIELSGKVFK